MLNLLCPAGIGNPGEADKTCFAPTVSLFVLLHPLLGAEVETLEVGQAHQQE
jgi:hypothetical protein